ncbi:hypothetical protein TSAR_004997 [Trichomalopsis sarcophagae]|uniref:EGF-like domain-containing protein n=1 Tax=Trichomalopsis sarcophagae TaxID=543379 RepID=A0A232F638_9HYME|nr:hypothetical protein TSAR_004997 [Trichomalopsis sarcophagae]
MFFIMTTTFLSLIKVFSIAASSHRIVETTVVETQRTANTLQFLVTNKSEIWRVESNGDKHRYSTNTTAIGDVDYHLGKNILIWIDAEKHAIHSQSLDINSTTPHVIFKQFKDWQPVALSVDFIGNKIYVTDILGAKVDVFELDGRYHAVAVGTDLVRPSDIKLDPYVGLLFILDGFRIVRASMDGSSSLSVIRQGIRGLHGFSIDLIDKRIYWARDTDFQVLFSNYLGEEVQTLGKNSSSQLIWTKFTTFNGSVFWAGNFVNYKSRYRIEEKEKHGKSIYQSNPVPSIKVLHAALQFPVSNPCGTGNGGCQQMCVLKSSSKNEKEKNRVNYTCACNVGWTLSENSKNCTLATDFLMYAQLNIMKSHLIERCTSSFCEPHLPIIGDKYIFQDFEYQYADNYLYYIKVMPLNYDAIYKVQPNNSVPEVFLLGKYENYQSLTIDHVTSNLYFTDSLKGTINVVSTRNNSQKALVLENLEQPEDIVIHQNKGFLFFFQTNQSTKITLLSRTNIDGSNLTVFHDVPLKKHCGFAIDVHDDTIYWYEWRKRHIQYSNLDVGEVRNLETSLTKYLYAISVHDKWIYVATTTSEGIWRFNKKTGEQPELILADFTNRITKVKVFSSNLQKMNSVHPCIINNGGCFEFCFGLPQDTNGSWTKVCANSNEEMCKNKNKCLSSPSS